jgi:hypothetical protein
MERNGKMECPSCGRNDVFEDTTVWCNNCKEWVDIEEILTKVAEIFNDKKSEEPEKGWFVCDVGENIELVPYTEGDVNYDSVWMNYAAPTKLLALEKYLAHLCVERKESILHRERIERTIKDVRCLLLEGTENENISGVGTLGGAC